MPRETAVTGETDARNSPGSACAGPCAAMRGRNRPWPTPIELVHAPIRRIPKGIGDRIRAEGPEPLAIRTHWSSPLADSVIVVGRAAERDRAAVVLETALSVVRAAVNVDRSDRRVLRHTLARRWVMRVIRRCNDPVGRPQGAGHPSACDYDPHTPRFATHRCRPHVALALPRTWCCCLSKTIHPPPVATSTVLSLTLLAIVPSSLPSSLGLTLGRLFIWNHPQLLLFDVELITLSGRQLG